MTIEDLRECARLGDELTSIKSQILTMEARLLNPKPPNLSGMPRSGAISDGSDEMIAYIELKKSYDRRYAELSQRIKDVEAAAEKLESTERQAIRYRYLQGMSISQTARRMHYDERSIHRILRKAESKLCQ